MSYFETNFWPRQQYQNIEKPNGNVCRSICTSVIVGFFMALFVIAVWNVSFHRSGKSYVVLLDASREVIHKTSPRFLSFGLDSSLLRDMKKLPINDERLVNLARHLSPAFVRIGGTSADCLIFNETVEGNMRRNPVDGEDISNFTLTDTDYISIYDFTSRAGLRMLFDLNVLIRTPYNQWDDSNAKKLIAFSKGREMKIDWQLGNEPNSFHHVFDRIIPPDQLGKDHFHLRNLLNSLGYEASILVGPETNHIGDPDDKGVNYASAFLVNDGHSVDFVTWHQYYLNGREAKVMDFIDPAVFNRLPAEINAFQRAINISGRDIKMWLSETSTAYGGGAPELSDRYVAGFLWLDKLGYSASAGVNVVIRQTLFGGNYAMVGKDLVPNPDWWVSVLYKKLVSENVLHLESANNSGTLRLYAHCTPETSLISGVPAVTIYGVNLDVHKARISIQGNWIRKNAKVLLYILTGDFLKSSEIRLNGGILKLKPDGSLPPFTPVIIDPSQIITLPPLSMAFIVIHGAEIPACSP
ncbi:heparanase [Fopius arisanus]|uniref:Heparanase n=1 Tax=Fopius arisanus TaxID=64838 RepID=A0A9R1SWL1_9HYME|nr:PREDICTED: heparanase-like [Fopius arisanus]